MIAFLLLFYLSFDYSNINVAIQGHMPFTDFVLDLKYLFTNKTKMKQKDIIYDTMRELK